MDETTNADDFQVAVLEPTPDTVAIMSHLWENPSPLTSQKQSPPPRRVTFLLALLALLVGVDMSITAVDGAVVVWMPVLGQMLLLGTIIL